MLCAGFSCSTKQAAHTLKIGLTQEPKTLNVWLASDANSRKILSQIYQPLYIREPDQLKLVPWLAEQEPVFDPETLSYTVRIRPAKWSDGTEVTSEDIAFTGRLIKAFRVPRYISQWKFVKKIETPDKYTVKFFLQEPMAIFLSKTLIGPVVQKKEWNHIAQEAKKKKRPLASLLNHRIENPVGNGPFVLKEWRRGSYLYLQKNKYFFGDGLTISGSKLGPYVADIIFKIYGTSDVAILALKKNHIDMFWWDVQPGYLEDLQLNKDIHIFFSEKSALYFMGFNVRKPPFNDAKLRRAVAMLIDRDFIVSRILQGYGTKMYSIVPPGNRFWHCPEILRYGAGLTREQRVKAAYKILTDGNYTWEVPPVDAHGNVVKAKGFRLPNGHRMKKFTILTPPADYDPHRAMAGMIIQEWLRTMGMPAYSRPMPFGSLLQQIKARHAFDTFILGYGKLSLDPDYARIFFHSGNDKKRGWNMSGYRNPEFDRLADDSERSMNPERRRELIWKMQKMILEDVPYIPLYNPTRIEAVRKGKFAGWVEMQDGIGNIWSFCQVRPV